MRLLVLTVVVAAVTATEQAVPQPYQFHKTNGANFVYGYVIPQVHAQGGFSPYFNAYGQPTFLATPLLGLGIPEKTPESPVVGLRSLAVPSAPTGSPTEQQQQQQQQKGIYKGERAKSSLSPLLKTAVDAGFLRSSGSSPLGSPQYEVSEDLAKEAGSVSELAYRLGAIPVAAVHDVQMRPNEVTAEESFAPVLHHKSMPAVTRYTLELPVQ